MLGTNEGHTVHPEMFTRGKPGWQEESLPTGYIASIKITGMNIGNRIKRLRLDANLTQRQLAVQLGCSFGLVAQWEGHYKVPGRDFLKKLSDVLLCDMEFLLKGSRPNGLHVTDPQQLLLLRKFRNLSPKQRENVLELLGIVASADSR